jgi:hypothetical protein
MLSAALSRKISTTSSAIKTTLREVDVLPTRKIIKPRKRPSQMQRPTEELVRNFLLLSLLKLWPANSVGRGSYVSRSDVSLMTLSNINLNLWAKLWLSSPSEEKHAWSEVQSGHQQTIFFYLDHLLFFHKKFYLFSNLSYSLLPPFLLSSNYIKVTSISDSSSKSFFFSNSSRSC